MKLMTFEELIRVVALADNPMAPNPAAVRFEASVFDALGYHPDWFSMELT